MSGLSTIKDESEDDEKPMISLTEQQRLVPQRTDSAQSVTQSTKSKNFSETSSAGRDQASPRSTDASETHSPDGTPASSMRTVANSAEMQDRQAKIRALKPDIQKYLQFQQEHMTYYHYFYKLDPTDFIHTEFIDLALSYEPLLYAVVGFAAYLYELRQPDPKMSHFLGYHSKSMVMLRKSLEKNANVTEATLLTVLQLATFEEYIGDWVNLAGHHRAAFALICDSYTPESMMETNVGKRIFSWAARLDVIVSLMSGIETKLDRPWFEANAAWYRRQISNDGDGDQDIENILAYFVSANRLVGMDMAAVFARFARQEISLETFHAENATIVQRMEGMKRQIELINDEYYRVQAFPLEKVRPLTADDIVNPYVPGGLFKDALWPLNFMWIDWYSIEQMQRHQTAKLLQQPMPPELELLSLEQCRIYEAIERWPDAPNGAILGLHASLGLATVFLRKDARHTMWARRKLAAIERLGYVFPPAFRQQMADMWGEPGVRDWWLPNDEGNIPMLKEIRKVVVERHENDPTTVESLAGVRDISAIFAKLDLRTQQPGHQTGENLSPRSDVGGANSDRGSNHSFSPTNAAFADHHSVSTATPEQQNTTIRVGTSRGPGSES